LIKRLLHGLGVPRGGKPEWLWKGRSVKVVDGTTVTMADTPSNRSAFPRCRQKGREVGFPIARVVALFSLAYGTMLDLVTGPARGAKTGETTLLLHLLERLQKGDILLGDRLFDSYRHIVELLRRGVDVVFRMHASRQYDFRRGRWLGKSDHVVRRERAKFNASRMTREQWRQLPEWIEIREIRFQIVQEGFRPNEVIVVTTLLDGEAYPKEDVAELYRERWHCELDLRSLKQVMQMGHLRCKTPEMVEKELWVHMLAYNVVRHVMMDAALLHDRQPRHLSFKGAAQTINSFRGLLPVEGPLVEGLLPVMLKAIATHRVGNRPNRVEPRKLKFRQGKYTYMTGSRDEERARCCA
jgi:hypothetical protein